MNDNNKFAFKKKRKIIINAISTVCALSMASCYYPDVNQNSDISKVESFNESQNISITVDDTNNSLPLESTLTEPTGFESVFNYTKKSEGKIINFSEYQNLDVNCGTYNLYMGFDNPTLLSVVREYYGDNSLDLYDVGYLSYMGVSNDTYILGFNAFKEGTEINMLSLWRYILEENGLRLWIDEIPYSFFEEKFPEYIQLTEQYGPEGIYNNIMNYSEIDDKYLDMFLFESDLSNANLVINDDNIEAIKTLIYNAAIMYNSTRFAFFTQGVTSIVSQGETADGKYILIPTEEQYNKILKDTNLIPGCENIDLLIPETKEDLLESGINYEFYETAFSIFPNGAKYEKNTDELGSSRSRSN